ncbi:MAG: hypothetical protein AAF316_00345 [Cyanobacteria bacterium P01_A01_bin.80]
MAHQNYQVLRGIQLPGKTGIVTGRVHNWLSELSDDIAPVSCWLINLNQPEKTTLKTLPEFLIKLATKLQENAGVNVCLDGLQSILMEIKTLSKQQKERIKKIVFQTNTWKGYTEAETRRQIKVADSLQLKSESSKAKYPEHIAIYEVWDYAYQFILESTFHDEPDKKYEELVFDFSAVRDPDEYSTGKGSFIALTKLIIQLLENPTVKYFCEVLSSINQTIKRGGFRKHGAVTTNMRAHSSLLDEYLDIPFNELSHVKKAVCLSKGDGRNLPVRLIKKLVEKYDNGEIFIDKYLGESQGEELRSNVCRGISLLSDDQCLIAHVNLGMISDVDEIPSAYEEVANFIFDVWKLQEELGFQLRDRQVAIGVVGLANLLRNLGLTYREFIDAQFFFLESTFQNSLSYLLVSRIFEGMELASRLGESLNMRAIHTVEPSESCARRYKDIRGFDLVPNINPPNVIPGIGIYHRHSQTGLKDEQGNEIGNVFNYGRDIESISQLKHEDIFALWDNWQKMINAAGLPHMCCYENWGEFTVTRFYQWLNSSLSTLYYQHKITTTLHLDKGRNLSSARSAYKEAMKDSEPEKVESTFQEPEQICESCSD